VRAGPGRVILRGSLPVDLLDQLDQEAQRRGIPVADLVDLLLVGHLPAVLAEAAEAHLRTSLAIAHHHAVPSPQNEENPRQLIPGVLSDEDCSAAHVERNYSTARPCIEGTSDASTA
jgi:hypothetical protein